MADHARRDGGVGDLVDEHEAARDAVFAVVVDHECVGGEQRGETDVVGRERVASSIVSDSMSMTPVIACTRTGVDLVVCLSRSR